MKNYFLNRIRKKLLIGFSYKAGRNFLGRKTIYTQGGGKFCKFFSLDFKRVLSYRYVLLNSYRDYNRNSLIGFIYYELGVFSYILLSNKIYEEDKVYNGFVSEKKKGFIVGESTFMVNFVLGNKVHHIELVKGNGAKLVRSSGGKALIISKDIKNITVKLSSGWLLKLSNFCVGIFGMVKQNKEKFVKAGDKRQLGFRPRVRGVAMNPCDHPHGGGEGKKPKPNIQKTPWGKNTKSPTIFGKQRHLLRRRFYKKPIKKKKK